VIALLTVLAAAVAVSFGQVLVLRRRLERFACAEHELRAPVTALALACERWKRDDAGAERAAALEAQLDRLRAGLADLQAARGEGRGEPRRARVDVAHLAEALLVPWTDRGGPPGPAPRSTATTLTTDRLRVAQVVGNLVTNAVEHGRGGVELRSHATPSGARLEVRNERGHPSAPEPGRGRGLAIAREAARELGGRVEVRAEGEAVVASLDLPAAPEDRPSSARRAA
jgi:two-component system sensor histidine kinase MtrB